MTRQAKVTRHHAMITDTRIDILLQKSFHFKCLISKADMATNIITKYKQICLTACFIL